MSNRRRIILINKSFQLRFALYVCSWMIGLGLAYPLILSMVLEHFFQYLAQDPAGPSLSSLVETKKEILWLLSGFEVALVGIIFFLSIFLSHRIAGPLYKLRKHFSDAKNGQFTQKLAFRRKDYFQELVPEYNSMMDSFNNRFLKTQQGVEQSIALLEKARLQCGTEGKTELESVLKILHELKKG